MLLLLLHRIVEINKTSEIVELDQSTTTIKDFVQNSYIFVITSKNYLKKVNPKFVKIE